VILRKSGFDAGEEVDDVAVWVAEIDGAGAPRLGCGRFYPGLDDGLQPQVFLIDIGDLEFEDRAAVSCGLRRSGDVFFLGLGVEDGEGAGGGGEFDSMTHFDLA